MVTRFNQLSTNFKWKISSDRETTWKVVFLFFVIFRDMSKRTDYRDLDDPEIENKNIQKENQKSSKTKLLMRPMRFILDYSDII